jgi:hypothetical protein
MPPHAPRSVLFASGSPAKYGSSGRFTGATRTVAPCALRARVAAAPTSGATDFRLPRTGGAASTAGSRMARERFDTGAARGCYPRKLSGGRSRRMPRSLPRSTVYPDAMTPEDQRLLFLALRELEYLERRDRARELRDARAWRRQRGGARVEFPGRNPAPNFPEGSTIESQPLPNARGRSGPCNLRPVPDVPGHTP